MYGKCASFLLDAALFPYFISEFPFEVLDVEIIYLIILKKISNEPLGLGKTPI